MPRVIVINHVTLDCVMQAPGRPARTCAAVSSTAGGLRHECLETTLLGGDVADAVAALARVEGAEPERAGPPGAWSTPAGKEGL
jgi:hypothetical protein